MDKEIHREIWHGKLPLCFKLHPDDVNGLHRPEPYYMMVPRVTYFPLVLDQVMKYFDRFLDEKKQDHNDVWIDYDGQPIRWQHPVGLSWDLLGSKFELPWRLILHFSNFPNELTRCQTKILIESTFMSCIKEADALKHNGVVIQNMVKKDHFQLWTGLAEDKFDQFWLINKRLMSKTDELFRLIPYKLYFPDYTYIQRAIKPCTTERNIFTITKMPASSDPGDGDSDSKLYHAHKCKHKSSLAEGDIDAKKEHRCTTMLDLIYVSFKDRLNDLLLGEKLRSKQHNTQIEQTKESPKTQEEKLINVESFRYRFLTHGIEVPFNTPLQWLSEHLSYPDNFLHICAVIKDDNNDL